MKCFPIIWSGSKLYVNRLGSSAITNKYKQEKKILDLLLLVHLLLSFLLLTLLRLLTLSFVYIDIHFVYLLLITISGTVLVRKGFKGIVLSRFRFFFCFLIVTGLVCSAVLKELSIDAHDVKENVLSNHLEKHSKYCRIYSLLFKPTDS